MENTNIKHNAIDFNSIPPKQFPELLQKAIEQAKGKIQGIKNSPTSFLSAIEALETATEDVKVTSSLFFNLHSAEACETIQELAPKMSELLSSFYSDLGLDEDLFVKVKEVFHQKENLELNAEQMKLLENMYDEFTRNGALLDEDKKSELREIDQKLAVLSPQFSKNVLDAMNSYTLEVKNSDDLEGLPESAIEGAKEEAKARNLTDSWVFTLQYPSYLPFVTYSKKRKLRHQLWLALSTRAFKDKYDNQKNVLETVQLRFQRAQLLGFKTHADYVLEKRMAESPAKVHDFLNQLLTAAKPAAEKDLDELKALAKVDGVTDLMPWDMSYYSEKLKQQKYNFNSEELRPYFPIEKVIQGVFEHARKLFSIEFKECPEYPVYHKDVKVYEVHSTENNDFVGLFYADFFPRPTKRSGAWMTNFLEQGLYKGEVSRPHVGIVCNFTKPTTDKPSLLSLGEVQTLFHEFGHALHGLLSQCTYQSLSGTNVYWDFVELPSQLMENWTEEKESLDLFAQHYKTGEKIPQELLEKIKSSSQFMAGSHTLRQIKLGLIDMAWHDKDPASISDVESFENQTVKSLDLLPKTESTNTSCSFSHIFAGGYSSGYYSYKWAEVLDADAFEYFKEQGLYNKDVAHKYKSFILEKGGTEHPTELYKKFRGREPDTQALLRRDGLQ